MTAWWQQLQRREQYLLLSGGVLVFGVLLVMQVIQPIRQHWQQSEQAVTRLETQLAWMQQQAPALTATTRQPVRPQTATENLPDLLSRTAATWQLKPGRIEPRGEMTQLRFEEPQPFDPLMRWCEQLSEQQGVRVAEIELEAASQPGLVVIKQLVFTRE